MEYNEFKEQIIDKTAETQGLMYILAVLWLHPERLPLKAVRLGNCTDKIIKIPNWSEKTRVIQWSSGPSEVSGPSVPIIAFGQNLFKGNTRITDIILQSNISGIPTGAFDGCSALKRITIPKSVKYIGEATFNKCKSLEDVYYSGNKEDWAKIEIIHEGTRVKDPKKLGLYMEIEHFPIPGNEPLLNANIHFNCGESAEACSGVTITAGGRDITQLFTDKESNSTNCIYNDPN